MAAAKLGIIVFSGDYDRVHYALITASAAAATDRQVTLFFTMEGIRALLDANAPVDMFHDTGYIASANPVPFLPNIRTISERAIPQETEPPPPNPRLIRLL